MEDHIFSCWKYLCTKGHLNLNGVDVGIVVLFFVADIAGAGAGNVASSEAWGHCAMCRMSHPFP